jgi:SAM-dependent methyltransferase
MGDDPVLYQIQVGGHLGPTLLAAFPSLTPQYQGTETVLTGLLPDSSALYGVIAGLEALGLDLLEVRRPDGPRLSTRRRRRDDEMMHLDRGPAPRASTGGAESRARRDVGGLEADSTPVGAAASGASAVSGYGPDMAYAHQTGHSDFVRLAAPAVLAELRAAGIGGGLVVDLGCGSGILAQELLTAGYQVLGVDLSVDMIELARRTAPDADFVHASYLDVDLPACAAVTSVGQSLGYAFDPRVSEAALRRFFVRVWQALRPGGLFVFDLNAPVPADDVPRPGELHWRETPDWTLLAETVVDAHALTRQIVLFRRVGQLYRRTEERHVVLLHEPRTVLAALASAGFAADTFDDYDGARFPAQLVGYRAVKPASGRVDGDDGFVQAAAPHRRRH